MDSQLQRLRLQNIVETKKSISLSVQSDTILISAWNSLESLQTISNTLSEKLREWFVLYLPEFSHDISDNKVFVDELLKYSLNENSKMGGEFNSLDVGALMSFVNVIKDVYVEIDVLNEYVEFCLKVVCPNVLAVAGSQIAAKLLVHAGGLKKLSRLPSSTIQVLGAEKALFRHLKKNTKCPKFGVLFNHVFVQKSRRQSQGKVARALADKICIASRVDFFKGEFIGDKLRTQLLKKFGFKDAPVARSVQV